MSRLLYHEVRLIVERSLKMLGTRAQESRHLIVMLGIDVDFNTEEFNVPFVASNYIDIFCQDCMSYNKFL
jgi:hypothetical protein